MKVRKNLWEIIFSVFFFLCCQPLCSQTKPWHNIQRQVRYTPDSGDFVIKNGNRRFNRALYGGNTAFRVEAGDLPEFAMYLPGMGGNFGFGIQTQQGEKWLIKAESIEARYRPGKMLYKIKDPLLGSGWINIEVIAQYNEEGMLIKVEGKNIPKDLKLIWRYGGVSGKKFSRDGDIGADPESVFYLTPEKASSNEIVLKANNIISLYYGEGRVLTENERYENDHELTEEEKKKSTVKFKKQITAIMPDMAELKVADATEVDTPSSLWQSSKSNTQVLAGKIDMQSDSTYYFSIVKSDQQIHSYTDLPGLFQQAESDREAIASRIEVNTPDAYINNLGGALAIAADAVWESPSYLHGAIAWRMPLVGWRGAYIADWLGWHGRAKTHFSAYAASQYLSPDSAAAAPDPKRHLARQVEEKGKSIFSKGYISRRPGGVGKPHHYDMNLVYIDQLIRHFDWSGDLDYLKEMWPTIERHLSWEKRNFDPDGDGLYNAYASIWASDALGYNGGGVAHSSAYNYYANLRAEALADLINVDGSQYLKEAKKIKKALDEKLWIKQDGVYGEYRDALGLKRVHEEAGLWSVYHLIDSEVPDPFASYQLLAYVDHKIPHIPVEADGLSGGPYYTLSTTNWMPYTWSVNNVAMAEVLHGALAYWQASRSETAFNLWKSSLLESMYLGASPGNFQQLSFYDAMRGELYRDFSDPVAMGARTLVEGLFGIKPMLLEDQLIIAPGFPSQWPYASLKTPDITLDYKKEENKERYAITTGIKAKQIVLKMAARQSRVANILVNGSPVQWITEKTVGLPKVIVSFPNQANSVVEITWSGDSLFNQNEEVSFFQNQPLQINFGKAQLMGYRDPQGVVSSKQILKQNGHHMIFAELKQGDFKWWEPISLDIKPILSFSIAANQPENGLRFSIQNKLASKISKVEVNDTVVYPGLVSTVSEEVQLTDKPFLRCGTNQIEIALENGEVFKKSIINWNIRNSKKAEPVDIGRKFNAQVSQIFKEKYLSPRSPYPTLQLPIQGLGDWCSYGVYMEIDDSGLKKLAGQDGRFVLSQNIAFDTPVGPNDKNLLFTSLWDNYPDSAVVSLSGKADHAYFLMTGTTTPMQSRFENGRIEIAYKDGEVDTLVLKNPETWWPIEQDYYQDGYAFDIGAPKPIRVHLKTGWVGREFSDYVSIDNFTKYAIDGGAAMVLDMALQSEKKLKSLKLVTTANEVIIGLMAVSLVRN